jgi:hypothetical protein
LHCIIFSLTYFCLPRNLGTIIVLSPISLVVLEKLLHVLFGDGRKGTSSGCLSVLVFLNHLLEERFDFTIHARFSCVSLQLKHVFNKK